MRFARTLLKGLERVARQCVSPAPPSKAMPTAPLRRCPHTTKGDADTSPKSDTFPKSRFSSCACSPTR
eukprot:37901-Chlamydomonas_euryale.AAC.3